MILVLLGGGYIFTIYGPDQCPEFEYFRAIVLTLQVGIKVTATRIISELQQLLSTLNPKYHLNSS